jgi:hypothetical protein
VEEAGGLRGHRYALGKNLSCENLGTDVEKATLDG